ncbi:Alpha/Beta hydrolase protein [Mycena latifolia]|nr:Alpha/Beta hydrolase protein [Mycena latifolia]
MARPYTEHTFKLSDGIELLYTDSGTPQTKDYTTLVVFHGFGFNGYGFVRLHEYAHKHNLRTILLNRRGYHGSTIYSDEELADVRAGRKIFQDRLALQIAHFLEHFIEHENTPKAAVDHTAGGFFLMGWSLGNATALSLFADPAIIPKPLYETIKPYLRSLVLYDPPFVALGYPGPPVVPRGAYDPLNDPDCPDAEQFYANFKEWISSYYKHPDLTRGDPSGMSFEKRTEKLTIQQWTEEQKNRYCDTVSALAPDLLAFVGFTLLLYTD